MIEGVYTPAQKTEVIRKLTDAMVSIAGENLRPVTWVVLEEVKSGDWGAGGNTFSTADVKALSAGKPPTPALHVLARSIARPDKVQELQTLLQNIIEPSRQEKGCLKYVLLQNANDPTDFTAVEEWTEGTAYQGHLSSPHVQAALGKFGSLTVGPPDIRHYRVVEP